MNAPNRGVRRLMWMSKRSKKYKQIEERKEQYRKLSSEDIKKRLSFGILIKEAQIAYREMLEERGDS